MKKIITVATAAVLCVIIAAGTAGCVGSTVSYSNNKDALAPVIVEQPQDLTVRRGEETQGLEVKAYTDDNGTLSYRWYSNATDSTEGGTAVEEANSSVLDIDTAVSGTTYYYCVITNTNDFTTSSNKTASVTSEAAMVRIYAETETPRIEEQPIAANYVIGAQEEAVPLSVSAKVSAGELSYQWYESATGTFEDGVAISGAINATYTPSLSERGQKYYYCEITNTDESASEEKTVSVRSKMVCISLDYDYEGFEFEAVDETTCKLTKYTGSSLKPVIPNTDEEGRAVVAIGAGVFGELSITEVTIPETVTEFGTLSQLNSGYGIPEDGVFYKCTSLHYIHYTGQADIIGDSCFRSCTSLETNVWDFCKQVKKIGKSAFQEVGSFPEELVLPETLESIDKYAFQKVSNVKKIIFETENITGIYGATFESMPDLEEVTIPASVTTIIEGFKGCYALKSFTYLRSVGVDGDVTQSNPFAKTTVEQYPDLVIYVPADCVAAYAAVLGSFAAKIAEQQAQPTEDYVFEAIDDTTCKVIAYSGDSLTPVIPETDGQGRTVVAIGAGAFKELPITEITIPETVTEFGTLSQLGTGYGVAQDGVFYKCTSLRYIHYTGQADIIGDSCFRSCTSLETNVWDFCKQVKKIGKSAFQEVGSLPEELVLPETLELIDKYAFQKVSNVKKITFATEKVTRLYGATFEGLPDLEEVTIPATITTLVEDFKGCYALKSFTYLRSVGVDGDVTQGNPFAKTTVEQYPNLVIYVPEDSAEGYAAVLGSFAAKIAEQQAQPTEDYVFEAIDDTTCKVIAYSGDSLTPVIPETDGQGRTVVAIGASAFKELPITEITIPETVTEFGTLSQLGTGYGVAQDGVFYKCTSLRYIHYTGQADIIGDSCFRSCTSLETNVWDFCKQVKKIGKSAFQEVGSLPEELVLPETLESIDKYAFQKVSNVKKITFATEKVTRLYGATFEGMPNLEEVTIPATITALIEDFKGCYALKSFTYLRSVGVDGDVTQSNPFAKTTVEQYPDLVIYVPEDSVEEYTAVLGSFAVKIAGQQA